MLTKGEATALRTILRVGGKVEVHCGRKTTSSVHTTVMERLWKAGFVRYWTAPRQLPPLTKRHWRPRYEYDYRVTAKGCLALLWRKDVDSWCGGEEPPRRMRR